MKNLIIWHNPRCSKSREAIKILEENNKTFDMFKYLDEDITSQEIKDVLKLLNLNARDLMRTKEDIYKELDLKNVDDEDTLVDMMVQHHKLIERPIIIKENKAIIGRPTSIIADFINN